MRCLVEEVELFSDFARGAIRSGIELFAVITLLESYFDDSSDDRRKRYCAYGGWIGIPAQWDAQLIGWGNASRGLREPFRSADCEGGHGQFKGVTKSERDARMAAMVSVMLGTQLRGFASVVPVATYRQEFPNSEAGAPSLLALQQSIMNMAYIGHELKMDVQMIFESGGQNAAIDRTFNHIARLSTWEPAKRLRSIAFDTKRSVHLQAADLVAREGFKHIDNKGIRPMRIPVSRLRDRLAFVLWNQQTLEFLARNGGPGNMALLAEWDKRTDAPRFNWYVIDTSRYTKTNDANAKS